MKPILKIVIVLIVLSFAFATTACSKKSHGYKYSSSARHSGSSYDPVATKHQPVRKKYIIGGQRNRILGQEKPN